MRNLILLLMVLVFCGADYELVPKHENTNFILVGQKEPRWLVQVIRKSNCGTWEGEYPVECIEKVVIVGVPDEKIDIRN